jgi:6-phosphogluconate dehydrogenase
MVGLGRMGNGLVRRLQLADHECFGYDRSADAVADIVGAGATGAGSLVELVSQMTAPRAVWVMVPAAFAGSVVREVAALLEPGDIVIDGGNSNWKDDVDLAEELAATGVHFVDIGTSGGVHGLERGFSLMIGGPTSPSSTSHRSSKTWHRVSSLSNVRTTVQFARAKLAGCTVAQAALAIS